MKIGLVNYGRLQWPWRRATSQRGLDEMVPRWTAEDETALALRVARVKHEYTPRYPEIEHSICTCGLAKSYCGRVS
jgi:hypothetical protein